MARPPLPPQLRDVYVKLSRAFEHVRHLEDEVIAYLERGPFAIVAERASESSYSLRADLRDQPPDHISAVFGDVLYNLRALA